MKQQVDDYIHLLFHVINDRLRVYIEKQDLATMSQTCFLLKMCSLYYALLVDMRYNYYTVKIYIVMEIVSFR